MTTTVARGLTTALISFGITLAPWGSTLVGVCKPDVFRSLAKPIAVFAFALALIGALAIISDLRPLLPPISFARTFGTTAFSARLAISASHPFGIAYGVRPPARSLFTELLEGLAAYPALQLRIRCKVGFTARDDAIVMRPSMKATTPNAVTHILVELASSTVLIVRDGADSICHCSVNVARKCNEVSVLYSVCQRRYCPAPSKICLAKAAVG